MTASSIQGDKSLSLLDGEKSLSHKKKTRKNKTSSIAQP